MFEIGSSLREARLRHGYELPEAEAATKIRGKYLRALEEERFELLPSQTYVKGFLRAYAEFLGLDGQLYVDEFNSRYGADDDEAYFRPRRQRPQSRAHRRVETRFVFLALVGIATVTALTLAAWQWGGPDAVDVPNLAGGRTTAPATTAPAPETTAAPASKPPAKGFELVLAAVRGSCWVTVNEGSAAGEPLFIGTIDRGTSRKFTSAKRLWLNVGAPGNVVAKIDGKDAKIPGPKGRPIVVFATAKGLKLATAG